MVGVGVQHGGGGAAKDSLGHFWKRSKSWPTLRSMGTRLSSRLALCPHCPCDGCGTGGDGSGGQISWVFCGWGGLYLDVVCVGVVSLKFCALSVPWVRGLGVWV